MNLASIPAYVAFEADQRVAAGDLRQVARAAKEMLDRRNDASILVFDGLTSEPVELDLRGNLDQVLGRLPVRDIKPTPDLEPEAPASRGPGRPKLGVVAREITLLPRHWEWLAVQPGGASVAVRKLVDEARRRSEDRDRTRAAQDAAYRFMSVMAGNKPHFEDAIRALFASDPERFARLTAGWAKDVRAHATMLAERAFGKEALPLASVEVQKFSEFLPRDRQENF
jgi:hypothetical protein